MFGNRAVHLFGVKSVDGGKRDCRRWGTPLSEPRLSLASFARRRPRNLPRGRSASLSHLAVDEVRIEGHIAATFALDLRLRELPLYPCWLQLRWFEGLGGMLGLEYWRHLLRDSHVKHGWLKAQFDAERSSFLWPSSKDSVVRYVAGDKNLGYATPPDFSGCWLARVPTPEHLAIHWTFIASTTFKSSW